MQIGWIDYSKEERNKIVNILRLLGTQGTIDEIGIGSVRDAFSDLLFPGISVLQTRAKYFVLIPYLFDLAIEESAKGKLRSGKDVRNYIEKKEDKIVETLINNARRDEDKKGVIGSRSYLNGRSVKTKPSSIYWNGMRISSILRYPELSLDAACNAAYKKGQEQSKIERKYETADSGADDADVLNDGPPLFDPISAKYGLTEVKIGLTREEAEYVKVRFTESQGTRDAAMSYMLQHPNLIKKYSAFEDFDPADFPGELSERVRLARDFADFIYGAHLLYNIIFADGCGVDDENVDKIKSEFEYYLKEYRQPSLDEIITMTNCEVRTARFLKNFDKSISRGKIEEAKKIIEEREAKVKHNRRKLLRPNEYQYEDPIHCFKLTYRYPVASRIMRDVMEGLRN